MQGRRRTRVLTEKTATISSASGSFDAVIDNVSVKGCLVKVGAAVGLAEGEKVEAVIHLEPGNPEFDIKTTGVVVRRDSDAAAMDFKEVSPEGFQHLLKLVQYNADNAEDIEKELANIAYDIGDVAK